MWKKDFTLIPNSYLLMVRKTNCNEQKLNCVLRS